MPSVRYKWSTVWHFRALLWRVNQLKCCWDNPLLVVPAPAELYLAPGTVWEWLWLLCKPLPAEKTSRPADEELLKVGWQHFSAAIFPPPRRNCVTWWALFLVQLLLWPTDFSNMWMKSRPPGWMSVRVQNFRNKNQIVKESCTILRQCIKPHLWEKRFGQNETYSLSAEVYSIRCLCA